MVNLEELKAIKRDTYREISLRKAGADSIVITVCPGEDVTNREIFSRLLKEVDKLGLSNVVVYQKSLDINRELLPAARVIVPDMDSITYVNLTADKIAKIVKEHVGGRKPVAEYSANFSK